MLKCRQFQITWMPPNHIYRMLAALLDISSIMFLDRTRRFQLALHAARLDAEVAHLDEQIQVVQNLQVQERRRRKRRRWWVKQWVQRRDQHGHYHKLMQELEFEDRGAFQNFTRMTPEMFHYLLERLEPYIQKQDTNWRPALPAGMKVAAALHYYAHGASYKALRYGFRIPHNTLSIILRDVSEAIIEEFADEVINTPKTPEEWKKVAEEFEDKWNVPHAVGAIDGKHVAIRKPGKSGSLYHNYKGFFSIILMAVVDADYKFLWVEAGGVGSSSDAQIFGDCELRDLIDDNTLGLPDAEPLPGSDRELPYFLLGDDAFPMRTWLMKPYSRRTENREQKIYNYRISRGRRVVENAFGILSQRFQCLLTTMRQRPETVTSIVLACCCLHNLSRLWYPKLQKGLVDEEDANHEVHAGAWRENAQQLQDGPAVRGNTSLAVAKEQRAYLTEYFSSPEGAVAWQDGMI